MSAAFGARAVLGRARMRAPLATLALVSTLGLASCGADERGVVLPPPPRAASPEADGLGWTPPATGPMRPALEGPATAEPQLFTPCPEGYAARECASFTVPLDWAHPERGTLQVVVARSPALALRRDGRPAPQLWMLQGGPGGSGADLTRVFADVQKHYPELELYTLDHRGVGASTRLGCARAESRFSAGGQRVTDAEWPACIAELEARWGAGLARFDATSAARDLDAVIARTRARGQDVFVYGVSYGTYWVHRYLQVAAEPPTGVVLDSIAPPVGQYMSDFEGQFDPVAKRLGGLCAASPTCRARLGPDPWERMAEALRAHKAGACPGAGRHADLRRALASMLMTTEMSAYVPPALWRLERCTPADAVALARIGGLGAEDAATAPADALFSEALYYNVVFGELWPTPAPTKDELASAVDRALLGTGGALAMRDLFDLWPREAPGELVRTWAQTDVPMLMINGDLDVQTPIETASTVREHFAGEHQTFVRVPNANHAVMFQSAVPGKPLPCGFELVLQFVRAPQAPIDTTCVAKVAPPDFTQGKYAEWLFGAPEMWGPSQGVRLDRPLSRAPATPPPGALGRRLDTLGAAALRGR